ncbi:DUF427 domain-containing protein [Falsirhodobacter sp. 20TX0035]|uniref:DUF427 domain-containing protein n=1 Tax=Falsirhodobacter sp. 20TX0035 TaxID=3022019 RepID=UPI00232AD555|nr:DUF427 domain-containing protein [Falsirhodobacter sp. 20TX0035]MDB6453497.1 DUF427 domain-containing protein [Falsirhodobacter sp. 20TX0035]
MASDIRIRKVPGRWVVRSDGAVLAETADALELEEDTLAPIILFPREDVAMAFLDAEGREDRALGTTQHFALVDASTTTPAVAWSVETPHADAARLAGHIAFDMRKVTVERL